MTTIAFHYKDKELATDSRCTAGTLIVDDNCKKITKVGDLLFACCGSVSDIDTLIAGYPHGFTEPINLEAQAFVVDDGEVYLTSVHKGEYSITKLDTNFCIGSGGDFALASMDFGASAKEAVKYAITRDCATGGKVRVVKVK